MDSVFEFAKGSATGAAHSLVGKPNQDAVVVRQGRDYTIVVVADGCSYGLHSEVGAHLGANIVASELEKRTHSKFTPFQWETARYFIRRALGDVLENMGGHDTVTRRYLVNEYLLFTLVAAVITPEVAEFAAIGDGFLCVNGEQFPIGPFPDNMPPYIGYEFTSSSIPADLLRWSVVKSMSTKDLEHFVLGSDGMCDYATTDKLGPLDLLWTEGRYFTNQDALRRKLVVANGGVSPRPGFGGMLPDDTTCVVGRRKQVTP